MRATAEIITLATGRMAVLATDKNGLTDWPVMYNDGRLGWDHPERYPKRVQYRAKTLWNIIRLAEKNHPGCWWCEGCETFHLSGVKMWRSPAGHVVCNE